MKSSVSPVTAVIIILVVLALAAGAWYKLATRGAMNANQLAQQRLKNQKTPQFKKGKGPGRMPMGGQPGRGTGG